MPDVKAQFAEAWVHSLLVVNEVLAHTFAAAVYLLLIKGLAALISALWPTTGLRIWPGTPYEFSVETIFMTSEIGIFVVYSAYAIVRGVRRCFGK